MNTLTKEQIDQVIEEIRTELETFALAAAHLERFDKTNTTDAEYLSYVNGHGGHYIKFLALLIKKLQFKNIVELGNREGLSTLAIYDQLPGESQFTTIDIVEDLRYCPSSLFTDKRVRILYGDVCDVRIISQVPHNIDFLFSDTIHYAYQVRDEFAIYRHLLADQALIAVDDIFVNDKQLFWDEIPYPKWDLTELCHSNGWGLFLYDRSLDNQTTSVSLANATYTAATIWHRRTKEKAAALEKITQRKPVATVKRAVKKIPGVYPLFCKINNRFNIIPANTRN